MVAGIADIAIPRPGIIKAIADNGLAGDLGLLIFQHVVHVGIGDVARQAVDLATAMDIRCRHRIIATDVKGQVGIDFDVTAENDARCCVVDGVGMAGAGLLYGKRNRQPCFRSKAIKVHSLAGHNEDSMLIERGLSAWLWLFCF